MLQGNFNELLSVFYGIQITTLTVNNNVVTIEYSLGEEKKQLFTTPHCLLAALTIAHREFKIPSEIIEIFGGIPHNEDGSELSPEQINQLHKSIKSNGLAGFKDGLMVMVVHPEPTD